jgi:hydroxymethylpyrimidine pyrophosphatase-like HAD family hydrolase
MSFGDQLNDISMIEEAHYGVAMINAVGELKSYTKYVTDYDFNNNGVIEFIKKHNLY